MIWINFESIRQYFYCKRKIYFRFVVRFEGLTTYKMRKGSEYHAYKFKSKTENALRNFWIQCESLGIRGFIDEIILKDNKSCSIIEYKQKIPFKEYIPFGYKAQLIAEALAVENKLGLKVEDIIVKIPGGRRIIEKITKEEIKRVIQAITQIRQIIEEEIIPEPANNKRKCTDCECRIVCMPI